MRSIKLKRMVTTILPIFMILFILLLPVYAETNHGGSGAGGETGGAPLYPPWW